MFVRFAEADAGVEADPLARDAGGDERIAPLAQIVAHFGDDIGVRRIVLHRLRRALHVHRAHADAGFNGQRRSLPDRP